MSKTYTICTVIRSSKIKYLEVKDLKKIHRDIWEIREPWNVLEMGILYEALCGSDSVCKGSNPFTAAKEEQTPIRVSVFLSWKKLRICRILLAEQAKPANAKVLQKCRFLLRARRVTRFSGTCSKSLILVTGEVLIPLPMKRNPNFTIIGDTFRFLFHLPIRK